ncbi:SMC-Scp complex subunit ScpB [Candidatus Parcubacteria bacterium]|jgi:segregation and condensation protein B|nr:MAG: SMC-Scp complex subunit ScpB [Candidatus Parcubacteria bacterium]
MLVDKIEALLFLAGRPLSAKKLAELSDAPTNEVKASAEELIKKYEEKKGGLLIQKAGDSYQMVSHPDLRKLAQAFVKEEVSGELTKPSLEALTIIAYRGPVTKAELEQIRGVNCSLILRNLLIRGLVEAEYEKKQAVTVYNVTHDFVRFLGLASVEELPDYAKLHDHETLVKLLNPDAAQTQEKIEAV